MRALIEAVKAEAEKEFKSAQDEDAYYEEVLRQNENRRDKLKARIDACNQALEALDRAAQSLVGKVTA